MPCTGAADDTRDSHPRRCSFPRGLHLHSRWQRIPRLQFKTRSLDFHAEPIPVHSPLLRESCLVSYPPLTYMLKFSGFADLTSCLRKEGGQQCPSMPELRPRCQQKQVPQAFSNLLTKRSSHALATSEAEGTLTHNDTRQQAPYRRKGQRCLDNTQ